MPALHPRKCNGAQAAIKSGYSERTARSQASQLLSDPDVAAEVARLQAAHAEASNVTMEKLFQGLALAFEVALAKENASAMNQILISVAKLSGRWVERHEEIGARDKLEAERTTACAELRRLVAKVSDQSTHILKVPGLSAIAEHVRRQRDVTELRNPSCALNNMLAQSQALVKDQNPRPLAVSSQAITPRQITVSSR